MKNVTIVIPTYKRPDRIERAVNSALNQSYEMVEVIVVDDNGSNEYSKKTKKSLQKYIEKGLITYITNDKNSGGSFSRNQGLTIAKGEYITFLDDDDEIDRDKIKKQVEKLEMLDDSYSCVYTNYHKIMSNGKIYQSNETVDGYVYPYCLSRSIYIGSGSNLLVKTSVAKEVGGYCIEFKRNQDLEFMTRILKNYKLAYVDEDLLTIHYEVREVKRSYHDLIEIDNFYYSFFQNEINLLPTIQQKLIKDTFALERFRYSLTRNPIDGIVNLFRNKVSRRTLFKYILYVAHRLINKQSYGFKVR